MVKNVLSCLICFLIIFGCGVHSNVILPLKADPNTKYHYSLSVDKNLDVPKEILEIMQLELNEKLSERNLLASIKEIVAYKANISITNFKHRHGVERTFLGIYSGCDALQTDITIINLTNSKAIGQSSFESTNCSNREYLDTMIKEHVLKICDYLSGK